MNIRRHVLFTTFILIFTSLPFAQDSTRHFISLPATKAKNLPFSDAVLVGNTLYISGRGGIDFKTMKVPGSLTDEVKLLLDDYKTILSQAGMTMDNLIYVTVYCPDLKLYSTFN